METWKNIPGYEGAYQVSNLGEVRSLDRTRIVNNCHGGRTPRSLSGSLMKPQSNGRGYSYVSLSNDGKKENRYIHRLVAEAFCENPKGYKEVNHKDHNKENNCSENLEWCSRTYNVNYSSSLMRKPKKACKATNTGIKYIRKQKARDGSFCFRVAIKSLRIDKKFKTLEEAKKYMEGVV